MSAVEANCGCAVSTPLGPTLADACGGSSYILFMTLVETFIRAQCNIDDPCGRATPRFRQVPDDEYDFIVIGSGCAGSVVTSRLSEVRSQKVLLIERGDDEPVGPQIPANWYGGSSIDYGYKTEPQTTACLQDNGVCSWVRGKVLGGTSVLNGMMMTRGNPTDYDMWAAAGNTGWSYREVLPYFKSIERNYNPDLADPEYHGFDGVWPTQTFNYNPPMSYDILRAGEHLGYLNQDINGANATGFMIAQMNTKDGQRYSTARAFIRPAKDRQNLHILLKTAATKVIVNPTTLKTDGVEIIDENGNKRTVKARKEVIVSGGAINSPQILLLSGIGPKAELEQLGISVVHDLPGVGKNFQNHVAFSVEFSTNEDDLSYLNTEVLTEYLQNRGGLMSGTGLSDVTAKVATPYAESSEHPDLQVFFDGYRANCAQTGLVTERKSDGKRVVKFTPTYLAPKSRGSITLASTDPLAAPRMTLNYLQYDEEIKALIWGIRFVRELAQAPSLQKYNLTFVPPSIAACDSLTFDSDEYWECAIRQKTGPENHQAGSCKMGPSSDSMAVVDNKLRVYGVSGLRVIDTSIMPTVIRGNTCTPAAMIAEKSVNDLLRDWGLKAKSVPPKFPHKFGPPKHHKPWIGRRQVIPPKHPFMQWYVSHGPPKFRW